jgi:lysophospholipase L1-like esterase
MGRGEFLIIMQRGKGMLIISILLNAVLLVGCVFLFFHFDGPKKLAAKFASGSGRYHQDMKVYHAQCSMFESLPAQKSAVVFLGNSILAGYAWHEAFPGLKVINRAIGGDGTSGVINRMDEILRHEPVMLILGGIGRSDIVFGLSMDSIMNNYDKIIKTAAARCKGIQVVMLSEIPWRSDILKSEPFNNNNIRELNGRIIDYARRNKCAFVDFAALVTDKSGNLDTAFTSDGVHPNTAAYIKLKNALDPIINHH